MAQTKSAPTRPPPSARPGDPFATERTARDEGDAVSGGYSLLVVSNGETSTYALPPSGRVVVGRARVADVRIDHPSVSREHAALHVGPDLRVEDLGSANGTRVRGAPIESGVAVDLRPDDVIDLGAILLVVRNRALTERRERTCHPALFELRVEDEIARLGSGGRPFAVARLDVDGSLSPRATQVVVVASLEAADLTSSPKPGRHDLLLLGATPEAAAERVERVTRRLAERGASVKSAIACCPRDGATSAKLLGVAPPSSPTAKAPGHAAASDDPIARDEAMTRVLRLLDRVAPSALSVLLLGETGVGKEVCAAYVHRRSPRERGPLLRLNCAALVESLIDAELFGHERGAFTGAVAERAGLLEAASGGTLFLDEIGDMPLATQVRLLRVLEAREVTRIGSAKPRPIDVRIVAATHCDLTERITDGRFREDLYYRLNGISVLVPPLRDRPADIEPLARHFLARQAAGRVAPELSAASLAVLRAHAWPGNVRELRNTIERAAVLCDGPTIEPSHVQPDATVSRSVRGSGEPPARPSPPLQASPGSETPSAVARAAANLHQEVEDLERDRIAAALDACGGNRRAAARKLGISRGALLRRLERLGLSGSRRS